MACNRIVLVIFLLFAAASGYSQNIKVKDAKQNFGFIHEGDTVRLSYEIINIGEKPLIISGFDVECGCTAMEKVNTPIAPGAAYIIKVTFDTHQKYDRQDRIVKIISNALNSPTQLRFKGVVLKPKQK